MTRRVIFALLYDRGQFMLSRNFRLQAAGGIDWLFDNYDFANVSRGLDELMVIDVSRGSRGSEAFVETATEIAGRCFIPMTIGGGITSFEIARRYMRSGADKLLINSSFASDPELCATLAAHYGRQCIVAGIDYRRRADGTREVSTGNGSVPSGRTLREWAAHVQSAGAGELLVQSIDQDGTGMGLDLAAVDDLGERLEVPCIVMGGIGKAGHIVEGLQHRGVEAVATANLFNFIGSAFLAVRAQIAAAGIAMAQWEQNDFALLRHRFASPGVGNTVAP